jgi:hypothetical protein
MSEETRKVLEMVAQGKVSVAEAEQLLAAVSAPQSSDEPRKEPRYIRIQVTDPSKEGKRAENVNIRVPLSVIRGGLRLGAFIPSVLGRSKFKLKNGAELDFQKLDPAHFEAMLKDLDDVLVDVDDDEGKHVRIRCE